MSRYSNIISGRVKNMQKCSVRSFSFRSIIKFLSIYYRVKPESAKPPYNFICQVGDPVLRQKAAPIDTKIIQTQEFQNTVDHLHKMLRKYDTVGLAAPQIGLPWQLFVIELREDSVNEVHPFFQKTCNIVPCPLTYFINPKLEIINPEEDIMFETCASINCYHAEVARPLEVEIKALNRFGEPFCWREKGWLARIAHHEMDHLKGLLYTDRMFPLTFDYIDWEKTYNKKRNVVIN
ncbi:Peptide deformylase, mitochondrial [Eufriesea mexicana]|uniref:Peptide deformylase n=1 Tax=Eufriesea mexicana TaxID=516756 RepID=A0A310SJV2_9HYME|nr:PREDICTED: peptide deformylase, mitochondrial-like [Eufriesea mexicana]OAD56781.1 Peptide deformylase, mitochondrial [Eufriesea mexicana]